MLGGIFYFHTEKQAPAPAGYSLAHIDIADSSSEREQGLSGHAPIDDEYGMLFVFPTKGEYAFWMKDMRFAIDIVWLADDGTILGVTKNLTPETYPETFGPPTAVRYALEVAAGKVERAGWEAGTKLSLPLE